MGKLIKKAVAITVLGLGFSLGTIAQTVNENFIDGRIWVKLKSLSPQDSYVMLKGETDDRPKDYVSKGEIPELAPVLQGHNVTKITKPFAVAKGGNAFGLDRILEIEFTDINSVDAFVEELYSINNVEYAEKVPLNKPNYVPNDPDYNTSTQWNLFKVSAEAAWDYSVGDPNIVVAIVDDAVEMTHPDLSASIYTNTGEIPNNSIDDDNNGYVDDVNGYDVADNDNDASPPNNQFDHGTIVAGIAGAETDNNTGISSIGFGISIMPVKSSSNPNVINNGYNGIVYAVNAGADVINISWGSYTNTFTTQSIIQWANAHGGIMVATAGVDDDTASYYPAAYPEVIAVASTDLNDAKSTFSNYGPWVDVCAPGTGIYSTTVGASYGSYSGTSLAVPMVSGLLGLIWSANPYMPKEDVIDCLLNNADNIDSQNTSYIGDLGAGRINAENSLQCADNTLLFPPTAMFTAYQEIGGVVNISTGGTVNFIDESTYNPTTWSWSFPGGTPSTSSQQNPTVVYNSAGTYQVTLTVLNNNGNDQEIKTGYVIVDPNSGCDTLHVDDMFNPTTNWPVTYCAGQCVNGDGYVSGTNTLSVYTAVAEYYNNNLYQYCWGTDFWFSYANSDNLNDSVTFFMKDGTGGTPGTTLASKKRSVGDLLNDVQNNLATQVYWDTPVTVPVSGEFFIGVEFPTLAWGTSSDDSLAVVTVVDSALNQNTGWARKSNGNWIRYTDEWTFQNGTAHYIDALMTDDPTVLAMTPTNPSPICEGQSIVFDATGSTFDDTLLWSFPGGIPLWSNNLTETVVYNTAGTYTAYLEIIGGACSVYKADSVEITVLPTPELNITTTGDTICPNGSTNITATGANTYSWTPSAGLSCTNCPNPVANPTTTTTYTLTGTGTNGCESSTSITIYVEEGPVANFIATEDTACPGDQIIFNGAVSFNAVTYDWTFQNGTPPTATGDAVVVEWNTGGTYQVVLTVENGCSQVDDTTWTIVIHDDVVANTSNSSTSLCTGDTVFYDATTSTGENTYSWSFTGGNISNSNDSTPNVIYNTPGSYTWSVTVTGPCGTDVTSGTVTVGDDASANVSASTFNGCKGDTIYYDGTGSIGASNYSWTFTGGNISTSSSATPAVFYADTGTYSYQLVVDGNCGVDTVTGTITISDTAVANVTASTFIACKGDTVDFDGTGSLGASTYSWSFTGGNISTSSTATPSVFYANPGTFTWELTVSGNCGNDTESGTIQIDDCVGIEELTENNNVHSFFNPLAEELNIKFLSGKKDEVIISVIASDGRLVAHQQLNVITNEQMETIDMSSFAKGVYMLKIESQYYSYLNKFSNF